MSIKVLEVFTKVFERGGEETIALNLFKNIDKSDIEITFMTQYNDKGEEYRKEIVAQKGKFIPVKTENDSYRGKLLFFKQLKKELQTNRYDVIHIHSGNIIGFVLGIRTARKAKVPYIIVHSHNSGIKSLKNKILKLMTNHILLQADKYLACSKEAAIAKFPNKIIKNRKFEVIKNGIEIEKFIFNKETRAEYRKSFNIKQNDILMGFIGRLEDQKNPLFLIDIIEKMSKMSESAKLMIVGDGTLKNVMLDLVKERMLEDKVIFLGERADVPNLLQAFDLLLLPSKYEGLGIVVIEAQAAGLPTFVSERVPEEGNITELFKKIPEDKTAEDWCKIILEELPKFERVSRKETIENKGYDIIDSSKRLKDIYFN